MQLGMFPACKHCAHLQYDDAVKVEDMKIADDCCCGLTKAPCDQLYDSSFQNA